MEEKNEIEFKDVIKNHKGFFSVLLIGVIACAVGLLVVLLLYLNLSMIGGYGTLTIGDFSIGTALVFVILLVLWELLLVVLPGCIFLGAMAYYWWKKLCTEQERELFKKEEKKKKPINLQKHGGAAGGFSFLITIAFLIIVNIDGHWLTTFNSLPYTYYVYAGLWGLFWTSLIVILPACILGFLWYFKYKK
ncbi:MAG: hypothetical protein ACFFAS_12260 [Promethearchaeota archaeon]